jgi:fructan beta-fructosidase
MFKKISFTLLACLFAALLSQAAEPEILIADFEWETWEGSGWTPTGEAFGPGPARGTLPNQMPVTGYKGQRLVNSFHGGDKPTGTLTSPNFTIERDYINFLIGGGGHEGKTCMNLLVDGKVVRRATGPNTQPGGSEALDWHAWDVADLAGKQAVLQIVDDYSGGWGHINVDHIVQSDCKRAAETTRCERSFTVDSKYLVMPIENKGSGGTNIHLYVGDEKVRQYQLHPASSAERADWYAFFTIERYKGKEARVVVDAVTEDGFALIRQSDTIPGEEDFYQEPHRPQFHFTQKVGWNNDPNGMVWHDGKWHLFFQHNPVGLPWGNMTWGHATSPDLLHWEQQPNKLFPKTMAAGDCFSGGATVDKHNTAGWGENTLVAFLTDTRAGEAIAYSTDGGDTFTYYEGNPVIRHRGRDPKVIWYAYGEGDTPIDERASQLGGHWVMVVYNEDAPHGRNTAFHTSTNLREWTFRSRLTGYYECPELYELPVDGDESNTRWVTYGADAQYVLGSFDGAVFTPDHEKKHRLFWGNYYAAQTFDNSPDGRRIQIGWARIGAPGPYNQHFTFPHVMTLRKTDDGIWLFAEPIEEIERLRVESHRAGEAALAPDQPVEVAVGSDLLDASFEIEPGDAESIRFDLPGRSVTYDVREGKLGAAALAPVDGRIRVRVLADRLLTEIIGNDGRVYITAPGKPQPEGGQVSVTAQGGDARLVSLEVHELRSIWRGDDGQDDASAERPQDNLRSLTASAYRGAGKGRRHAKTVAAPVAPAAAGYGRKL